MSAHPQRVAGRRDWRGRVAPPPCCWRGWVTTSSPSTRRRWTRPSSSLPGLRSAHRLRRPSRGSTWSSRAPGCRLHRLPVAAARAAGVPVISEVELASRHLANPIIGVTGTNGKTTTTELTAHLLVAAGIAAVACGNQGTPLSGLVGQVDPGAWLVVECSSFQLEDIAAFHPRAAVLAQPDTRSPGSTRRSGGIPGGQAPLFENQDPRGPGGRAARHRAAGRRGHRASRRRGRAGAGAICWSEGGSAPCRAGTRRSVGTTSRCAVVTTGRTRWPRSPWQPMPGADAGRWRSASRQFPGVAHRLEVVADVNGVRYVNDSKATNPDAALGGARRLPGAGPSDRRAGGARGRRSARSPQPPARRWCGHTWSARRATRSAGPLRGEGIPVESSGTIAAAVRTAAARATAGDVVLLAPACTSFDQYANFEERGEDFRAAVHDLTALSASVNKEHVREGRGHRRRILKGGGLRQDFACQSIAVTLGA